MLRHLHVLLFALALIATPTPAFAASALGTVVPQLAKDLGEAAKGSLVVASTLTTDVVSPKGDELAVRVASLLAGQLGGDTRAHAAPLTLAGARAVAGKSKGLVFVAVELQKGQLRVTVDRYPVLSNGWDRLRLPPPPPVAHAFATVPIDAEVRTFLPPILLEQAKVTKASHAEGDVLAAACGDVDGDGGLELVLVSRLRVAVGRIRSGQFAVETSAAWSALAPLAPSPLREALGGASVDGPGRLLVGTTDRGGVQLDAKLAVRERFAGVPAGASRCAVPKPELGAFAGELVPCVGKVEPSRNAARFDAVAYFLHTRIDGAALPMSVTREAGTTRVRKSGDERILFEGAGAQLAFGDLDLDGQPEIVSSADATDDTLRIQTLADDGTLRERLKVAAPAGVRALAICPPEESGAQALIAIVGAEVWLVR
jgi:hypothetical protein